MLIPQPVPPETAPSDRALQATYGALAQRFTACFTPGRTGARTVGREAEFPVVTADGKAANVRKLWDALAADGDLTPKYEPGRPGQNDFIVALNGADYSYALEVGVGTVELNTRPCQDLLELQAIQEAAVRRLVHAAARFSWRVLAYGMQPLTPPSLQIMAPKQRYLSLYRAMGASWLWYTVTASDQVQVSIGREEMVEILNVTNLMTPVIIALCANSPIYGGQLSPYVSAREGEMAAIYAQEHRHGMLPKPVQSMTEFVEMLAQSTYLIVRDDNEIYPSSQPFSTYLQEHGPDFDAFLFHDHYMWNSARLRAAFSTVEIRPACQQPWREHMALSALGLGMVEAAGEIGAYVRTTLGEGYWAIMQEYHTLTIRHGLRAPQPAPDFVAHILELAETGLHRRGFGEAALLAPLWARVARQLNPGQRARLIFRTDGLHGLLAHATVPPSFGAGAS